MSDTKILSSFSSGGMRILYLQNKNGCVGLTLLPEALAGSFTTEGNWNLLGLCQVKLAGDLPSHGYAHGRTMLDSESSRALVFQGQTVEQKGDVREIVTVLESARLRAEHVLLLRDGAPYLKTRTRIMNRSDADVRVEMLASFCLTDIPAVGGEERMRDLELLRLQSRWSGEGKLLRRSFLDLHMEPSWLRMGCQTERFGQVGTMPVRGWFPWAVIEDKKYGWCLGAQLAYNGSWQMELFERDDKTALSGGLADREFGHFLKTLRPGESLTSPEAVLAASMGDVDRISWCLTRAQEEPLDRLPESERNLPVLFNEYCTTWGEPSEENLKKIIRQIRGRGFAYLVIDAGWYADGLWYDHQGDWRVSSRRFPSGLKEICREIREAGMIPGLWCEMEILASASEAFRERTDLILYQDGLPLQDGSSRFLDLRKPEAVAYLDGTIGRVLAENGFGYLKVDYNANLGLGPDGPDGFGEELRTCALASRDYFRHLRELLPELVIENCSSGGHRLEPSMMAVSSMASFSDAHECESIPLIAANVQRAILPRQSQIWAVLRAGDSDRRLIYSLISGLLGRLCVSGDVADLNDHQWSLVDEAVRFYGLCAPVIRSGFSRKMTPEIADMNHPTGDQVILREGTDGAEGALMAVVHRFRESEGEISVALPGDGWNIRASCHEGGVSCRVSESRLILSGLEEMSAAGVLLEK